MIGDLIMRPRGFSPLNSSLCLSSCFSLSSREREKSLIYPSRFLLSPSLFTTYDARRGGRSFFFLFFLSLSLSLSLLRTRGDPSLVTGISVARKISSLSLLTTEISIPRRISSPSLLATEENFSSHLTRRNREVVDFKRYRVKNLYRTYQFDENVSNLRV